MLPTSGYFRGLACPAHEKSHCSRPYCHFHHSAKRDTSDGGGGAAHQSSLATEDEKQDTSKSTSVSPVKLSAVEAKGASSSSKVEDPLTAVSASLGNQSDLLQQLVSEAVKKVLIENPHLAKAGVDSSAIIAQTAAEVSPGGSGSKKNRKYYLRPPDTPSYNPTPIKVLNKRKRSSEGQDELASSSKAAKYVPRNLISDASEYKESGESEATDFSSPEEEDLEQRNCDFDILEEVLAEHSQNNKIKVKKKKVKALGKLKYNLGNHDKKVDESAMIADAQIISDQDSNTCDGPKHKKKSYEEPAEATSYFLPPSPVFTSSSDGFGTFNSITYSHSEAVVEEDGNQLNNSQENSLSEALQADEKKLTEEDSLESSRKASQIKENGPSKKKVSKGHTNLPKVVHTLGAPKMSRPSVRSWNPQSRNTSTTPADTGKDGNNSSDPIEAILQQMDGEEVTPNESNNDSLSTSTSTGVVGSPKNSKKYKVDLDKEIKSLTSSPSVTQDGQEKKIVKEKETDKESEQDQDTSEKISVADKTPKKGNVKSSSKENLKSSSHKEKQKKVVDGCETESEKKRADETVGNKEKSHDEDSSEEEYASKGKKSSDESEVELDSRKKKRKRDRSSGSDSQDSYHRKKRKKSRKRRKKYKKKKRRRDSRSESEESDRDSLKDDDDDHDEMEEEKENDGKEKINSSEAEDKEDSGKVKKHKKRKKKSRHRKKSKHRKRSKNKLRKRNRSQSESVSLSSDQDRSRSSSRHRSKNRSRSSSKHSSRSHDRDRSGSDSEHKSRSHSRSRSRSRSNSSRRRSRSTARRRSRSGSRHRSRSDTKHRSSSRYRSRSHSKEKNQNQKKMHHASQSQSTSRGSEVKEASHRKDNKARSSSSSTGDSPANSKHVGSKSTVISTPMPIDPSKIKVEKDDSLENTRVIVPDLSIVKKEKEDVPSLPCTVTVKVERSDSHNGENLAVNSLERSKSIDNKILGQSNSDSIGKSKHPHEEKKGSKDTSSRRESSSHLHLKSSKEANSHYSHPKEKESNKEKESHERRHSNSDRRSSSDSVSNPKSSRHSSTDSRKAEKESAPEKATVSERRTSTDKNKESSAGNTRKDSHSKHLSMFDMVLASVKPTKPKVLKEISMFDKVAPVGYESSTDSSAHSDYDSPDTSQETKTKSDLSPVHQKKNLSHSTSREMTSDTKAEKAKSNSKQGKEEHAQSKTPSSSSTSRSKSRRENESISKHSSSSSSKQSHSSQSSSKQSSSLHQSSSHSHKSSNTSHKSSSKGATDENGKTSHSSSSSKHKEDKPSNSHNSKQDFSHNSSSKSSSHSRKPSTSSVDKEKEHRSSSHKSKEHSKKSSVKEKEHSSSSHHKSKGGRDGDSIEIKKDPKDDALDMHGKKSGIKEKAKRLEDLASSSDGEPFGGEDNDDGDDSDDDGGNNSPFPDLSALDEIPQDEWEQMINSSGDNEKLEEDFDMDDFDKDDPDVLKECLQMYNEYKPELAEVDSQVSAKRTKVETKEELEPTSSKHRVARSLSVGNKLAPKPGTEPKRQKKNPTQVMMERYQKLKDQQAELLKQLERQKQQLEEQGREVAASASSSSAVSSTTPSRSRHSVVSSSSVSSTTPSRSNLAPATSTSLKCSPHSTSGLTKRRISASNSANSILQAREKMKNLPSPISKSQGSGVASTSGSQPPQTLAHTVSKGGRRLAHVPKLETLQRPTIAAEFGSKVPQNIRQRYLNSLIDECLKFSNEREAFNLALAEEQVCNKRASSRMVYLNLAVNAVKRLRTQQEAGEGAQEILETDPTFKNIAYSVTKTGSKRPSTSSKISSSSSLETKAHPINPNHSKLSHFSVLAGGGQRGSWSIEKPKKNAVDVKNYMTGMNFYNCIKKYILDDEKLGLNGYPYPDPNEKGKAMVKVIDQRKKLSPSSVERYCDRCSTLYTVDKWGFPLSLGPCVHHWGRAYKRRGHSGGLETRYSCCSGDLQSEGCCQATTHVSQNYDPTNLKGYVRTLPKEVKDNDYGVYALDCEMSYTTNGNELTRITIIDSDGKTVYEQLVKPENPIIDYNTRFSGITESDMEDVKTTIQDVQASMLARFSDKTILIGHSLESDFHALKIIHDTVVDTSVVFPHKMGPPYKRALKNLASEYLKKLIQNDVSGHDSAEDAITCMHLMQWRVKEDLKGFAQKKK